MTRKLEASNNKKLIVGTRDVLSNTVAEALININNCGMMIGKPRIAIMAAFCCAFAAMAAKKVNIRLKLHPPKKTNPMKMAERSTGYFMNSANKIKLSALIASISMELNNNFARIKFTGPEMV